MTHVVCKACFGCKYTDCVTVCPVECFYEGEQMLYIHPDECIDCGVCEPECPADAIRPDEQEALHVRGRCPSPWAGIRIDMGGGLGIEYWVA